MLYFECDYNNGCHPAILKALADTNDSFTSGYGEDQFTKDAVEKIAKACGTSKEDIFILTGGTQTNMVVISSVLQNWQGVLAADTGHISLHESGAIEASGHKVITLKQQNGKISNKDLSEYLETYYADANKDKMVWPGMVYISFPTEYGTIYTKQELTDIYATCHKYNLSLFVDGARLGYALASPSCDISLPQLCQLCDILYIGGTKVGALCGEAVVFTHSNTPQHFISSIKQRGALLAKGRLNGVQFATLFTDGLYFEISKHAVEMAELLKSVLKSKGYRFFLETCTNQQFVILDNAKMAQLAKVVKFDFWEKYDNEHTVVRFCTSWRTTKDSVEELASIL